jgi:hypothetical protein
MRILHVISGLRRSIGGPVTQLLGLAPALRERGLGVGLLSSFRGDEPVDVAEELRQKGCDVELIGPGWTALGWHPRLNRRLVTAIESADVVHIHGLWEQIQHETARQECSIPGACRKSRSKSGCTCFFVYRAT